MEHLAEDTDISFALRRDELGALCEGLLSRFRDLLNTALFTEKDGTCPGTNLGAIEVLGGGVRMQVVQQAIHTVCGSALPFGFKLDDSALALGAALLCVQARNAPPAGDAAVTQENPIAAANSAPATAVADATIGLSPAEVDAAYAAELSMQAQDFEITQVMEQRNKLESFILEMRSAPGKKQGNSIDSAKLNALLDEYENWMWDAYTDPTATLEVYLAKYATLHETVSEMCKSYFEAVETERAAVEKALDEVRVHSND